MSFEFCLWLAGARCCVKVFQAPGEGRKRWKLDGDAQSVSLSLLCVESTNATMQDHGSMTVEGEKGPIRKTGFGRRKQ